MFGWLKKATETINPPDMFDRIKTYEEYCYKQFRLNTNKGDLDAYGPSVALDLPFAWREDLIEAEKIANDPDYVSANRACQDVLDRIMKTTIDKEDE